MKQPKKLSFRLKLSKSQQQKALAINVFSNVVSSAFLPLVKPQKRFRPKIFREDGKS